MGDRLGIHGAVDILDLKTLGKTSFFGLQTLVRQLGWPRQVPKAFLKRFFV